MVHVIDAEPLELEALGDTFEAALQELGRKLDSADQARKK